MRLCLWELFINKKGWKNKLIKNNTIKEKSNERRGGLKDLLLICKI